MAAQQDVERTAPPRSRRRKLALGLLTVFLCLGFFEVVLRIAGPDFGWRVEAPLAHEQVRAYLGRSELWSDADALSRGFSLYEDRRLLLWGMAPDRDALLDNFLVPAKLRKERRFHVRTNGQGYRAGTDYRPKGAGGLRIACFGDSHTFGWGFDADDSFPARLEGFLSAAGRGAEVLNFGQPGYSSLQGRRVVERAIERFDFDAAILAFGFNDRVKSAVPDAELVRHRRTLTGTAAWALRKLRIVRAVQSLVLPSGVSAPRVGNPSPRVSGPEYRANLEAMVKVLRSRGVSVVLLSVYNGYRGVMQDLAGREKLPFVDADALADALGADMDRGQEPEARAAAESAFGKAFVKENPKYRLHADAAHYNAAVHARIARALAEALGGLLKKE
jgi:lysophospholipase L1-like esterase